MEEVAREGVALVVEEVNAGVRPEGGPMKLKAFAVLDEKSGGYGHPFFTVAEGQAMRLFGDWANDKGTPVGRHPGDYQLYRVGSWDDEEAELVSERPPVYLARGSDFVEARVVGPREVVREG